MLTRVLYLSHVGQQSLSGAPHQAPGSFLGLLALAKQLSCPPLLLGKPQLLQGVYAMGFNRPSKIQENALPMMLAEPVCPQSFWFLHTVSFPAQEPAFLTGSVA
ncbi:hypothetical protein STEG23_022381, partial [Scotinomys teguina]